MPPERFSNVPVDEITDEQLEPAILPEQGFSKCIVVDNIPVVPEEKFEKLQVVLLKVFKSIGNVKKLHIPKDKSQNTKGYAFVEYATQEEAATALEKTKDYKLDKTHTFRVNSYDDFLKYTSVPDKYEAPAPKTYAPKANLRSWLLDPRELDQYVMRYGDTTEIAWNDLRPGEEPESVFKRPNWSESYVAWSPKGTYLLTMHNQGVAIWGGPQWQQLMRFVHPGVQLIDFSPCERFLVTASPKYKDNDNPKDPQGIIVWDVSTGRKVRGFLGTPSGQAASPWPIFKWSFDGKYVGRISEDAISIYETPSMDLLDKKSLKIPGVKDFAWSPVEHVISYYVPMVAEKPASVVLLEIPSRREKRQKSLFDVTECKMYWHPAGTYLSVKADRQKKKQTVTDFQLFHTKEKDIPIEQLELKDHIITFAWEPQGTRFAIVHGEGPRPDVSFYVMEKQVRLLKTLEKKPVNQLLWSPQGSYIVLAGLHNLNGVLEFFNVNDMESMGTEEHYNASVVDWDPTGRYVTSVVSFWRVQLENGYNVYNFQGKLQKHVLKERFMQLLWRPRPATLLAEEQVKDIKKNIHKLSKEYKEKDNAKKKQEREERRQKRLAMRKDFEEFLAQKRNEYSFERDARKKLRNGEDSEDESNIEYAEEWVEEAVDFEEVVIEDN